MVIDTSALLAIFLREPERRAFLEAIESADTIRISVATVVEASIVIELRHGASGLHDFESFLAHAGVEIIPVDRKQGQIARNAFSRFGKGRHRARLNFGDCFAYAAAMSLGEPLLCKGNDFVHTDLPLVECPSV